MPQTESINDITPSQVIPSSQLDNDPIDYASSMTSAYQQDELDDGKIFISRYIYSFEI
jgi:hypothetical protein